MGDRHAYLRVAAVGLQVAVAAACVLIGWKVMHGAPAAPSQRVQGSSSALNSAPVPALLPGQGTALKPAHPARVGSPGLADLVARVNRDDTLQYRGQWRAVRLLADATRDYLERHVVPLLLAAARGVAR